MNMSSLYIRHLCFTGSEKPPALIEFQQGLNVIYGASDTGKSFILEAINFMLGGKDGSLRDIPERDGYDQILLGIEVSKGTNFTLVRSTQGGDFRLLQGLHAEATYDVGETLAQKYNEKNDKNVSTFLLDKIGLHKKKIKNKKNSTGNLSFRHLCPFFLINEESIQKRKSPIISENIVTNTSEYSSFKLLLTGVDDSSLVFAKNQKALSEKNQAKVEVLQEVVSQYRLRLSTSTETKNPLEDQLERIERSINEAQISFQKIENEYYDLSHKKKTLFEKLENGLNRKKEIDTLISRFNLLGRHYQSDLERLDGISEAGSLLSALDVLDCPLCGISSDQQHKKESCDGNVDKVVIAAKAEKAKIVILKRELDQTMQSLELERLQFSEILPKIKNAIDSLDVELRIKESVLFTSRTDYTELVEIRSSVKESLLMLDQIEDLENRLRDLRVENNPESDNLEDGLPSATLASFCQKIESVLQSWNFPESDRVFFNEKDKDIEMAGKKRGSRGKGMRAITHAAFTVSLLEFCRDNSKPHSGFVIMDTPLLAYREPDGEDDDLRKTDVQEMFYKHLEKIQDRQIIIIENVDPPISIQERSNSTKFTKNPNQGRYGFFPNV